MEQKFESKEELFKHLKANKELLIAEKKASIKHADAVSTNIVGNGNKTNATKGTATKGNELVVKAGS